MKIKLSIVIIQIIVTLVHISLAANAHYVLLLYQLDWLDNFEFGGVEIIIVFPLVIELCNSV